MVPDLNELLLRCVEVEKERMLADFSLVVDSFPYFIHTQESFPYFTHRIGDMQLGYDSEDMDRDVYTVIIRLVIGHVTSNYVGINESSLYSYIPSIVNEFESNEGLTSAAYPVDLLELIQGTDNGIKSVAGFRVFLDGGLKDVKQVGTEFTYTALFNDDV